MVANLISNSFKNIINRKQNRGMTLYPNKETLGKSIINLEGLKILTSNPVKMIILAQLYISMIHIGKSLFKTTERTREIMAGKVIYHMVTITDLKQIWLKGVSLMKVSLRSHSLSKGHIRDSKVMVR